MAFEEFELSKQGKTTLATKAKGLALLSGGRRRKGSLVSPLVEIKRSERHTTQGGSPEYLSRLCWCIAERNRLLGLYHPDSQPFLVEHEPDVKRYERARGAVAEALGEGEVLGEGG